MAANTNLRGNNVIVRLPVGDDYVEAGEIVGFASQGIRQDKIDDLTGAELWSALIAMMHRGAEVSLWIDPTGFNEPLLSALSAFLKTSWQVLYPNDTTSTFDAVIGSIKTQADTDDNVIFRIIMTVKSAPVIAEGGGDADGSLNFSNPKNLALGLVAGII